jgi:endonuclease/exonuclease/phosphatase family metal-dependent hydrolase
VIGGPAHIAVNTARTRPHGGLLQALIFAACALSVLLSACASPDFAAHPLTVDVMSFNIRYGTADDGLNSWPKREELVYDVIRGQGSDFVGLQEALRFQIDGIREAVPGYGEVGMGREDGREAGEYSAILYKENRWRAGTSGTLWLSDTPDVPGSRNWGNDITRIVTWARFIEQDTGRAIWVFNTHFDHVSQPSREKSAELLALRIAERDPRDPVIVTGDFNAGEYNPAILYLKNTDGRTPITLVDTYRALHPDVQAVGTFGEFTGRQNGQKIDYVFAEPDAAVHEARIVHFNRDGRYPSDHFPVYAKITLQPR